MLVRFFKKNYFNQYLLIFFLSILLWVGAFIAPQPIQDTLSYSFLYEYVYNLLLPFPFISVLLAYIIIVLQGLFFNTILVKHKLISSTTLLPMFVYIFVFSSSTQTITPILLSNIFVLLALNNLLDCENISKSQDKIFRASALVSIAILFYFLSIYYLLLIILVIIEYKIYYWREWVTAFLGFTLPLILVLIYCFLTDSLMNFVNSFFNDVLTPIFVFDFNSWLSIVFGLLFILIFSAASFNFFVSMRDNVVAYRTKSSIILYIVLVAFLMSIYSIVFPLPMQLYVIPFSYFIGNCITRHKGKETMCDIVLIVLTITVFGSVYLL